MDIDLSFLDSAADTLSNTMTPPTFVPDMNDYILGGAQYGPGGALESGTGDKGFNFEQLLKGIPKGTLQGDQSQGVPFANSSGMIGTGPQKFKQVDPTLGQVDVRKYSYLLGGL